MRGLQVVILMLLSAVPTLAFAGENGLDAMFGSINGVLAQVIFFDIFPGKPSMPHG